MKLLKFQEIYHFFQSKYFIFTDMLVERILGGFGSWGKQITGITKSLNYKVYFHIETQNTNEIKTQKYFQNILYS